MENDQEKIAHLYQLIEGAETSIRAAKDLLAELSGRPSLSNKLAAKARNLGTSGEGKIIEGVFDGEYMLGPDQKKYPVPANYASKSKLVQGDTLKLTINDDGSFIFKQIGPVERKKIVGTLTYANGDYRIIADGKAYKVLFASITYYKAQPGDSVTLVVPADNKGEWGAIENVIDVPEKPVDEAPVREQTIEEIQSGEPMIVSESLPVEKNEEIPVTARRAEDTDISSMFEDNQAETESREEAPNIGPTPEPMDDYSQAMKSSGPAENQAGNGSNFGGSDQLMDQEIRELEI